MLSAIHQFLFCLSLDVLVIKIEIEIDRNMNYCNLKYFPSFPFLSFNFSFDWSA